MQTHVPSQLIAEADYANQFGNSLKTRNSIFEIANVGETIGTAGGTVGFHLEKSPGFYNLKDSTLSFIAKITTSADTAYSYDFSRIIDQIDVMNNGETLFSLQNAWVVEAIMMEIRGTEAEDLLSSSSTTAPKGNALLYRRDMTGTTSAKWYHIAIPMSRFGQFFENEKYYNFGTTTIRIRLSALADAVTAGAIATVNELTDMRFTCVEQNLDSTVMSAFEDQLSNGKEARPNQTYYYTQPFGYSSSTHTSTISALPTTESLDRVGGFITEAGKKAKVDITAFTGFDLSINGEIIKPGGIRSVKEMITMTMEGCNITSNQLTGMSNDYMAGFNATLSSVTGSLITNFFLFQTALEQDERTKSGLQTTNRQKISGSLQATASSGATLYVLFECTGTLVQSTTGSYFIN